MDNKQEKKRVSPEERLEGKEFIESTGAVEDLGSHGKDETILARFGKRQQLQVRIFIHSLKHACRSSFSAIEPRIISVLQRGFGPFSAIALTSTLMITWEVITWSAFSPQHCAY